MSRSSECIPQPSSFEQAKLSPGLSPSSAWPSLGQIPTLRHAILILIETGSRCGHPCRADKEQVSSAGVHGDPLCIILSEVSIRTWSLNL